MFRCVLVPLDGSALSRAALGPGATLAAGGRLLLLHAVTPAQYFSVAASSLVVRERRQSGAHLERLAEPLRARGLDVETVVKSGEASKTIVDAARAGKADLIVMASHGRGGAREWVFGSIAERVLRRSFRPALVLRGTRQFPPRRILVPLDGSGREAQAMKTVRSLAAATRADVLFLHVGNAPKGALAATASGASDAPRLIFRNGEPAETILRTAVDQEADIVTLCVTTRGGGVAPSFGRVAERVLKLIDRSVLVVRVKS